MKNDVLTLGSYIRRCIHTCLYLHIYVCKNIFTCVYVHKLMSRRSHIHIHTIYANRKHFPDMCTILNINFQTFTWYFCRY